jgi:hypothetical protein
VRGAKIPQGQAVPGLSPALHANLNARLWLRPKAALC